MKKICRTIPLVFLVACCTPYYSHAQKMKKPQTGLFVTASDFASDKLTYTMDADATDDFIHADPILSASKIIVRINGEKHFLSKKDFFGYKDANSKVYRFYKNQLFEILDTTGFYLYAHPEHTLGGKGYTVSTVYYFSDNAVDPLARLSIPHLIDRFPSAIKFHYALSGYINNEKQLIDYDRYSKNYKVKYLYHEYLK